MATIGLTHYLVVAAILFGCGIFTMITKRNAIGILIGVELVLNTGHVLDSGTGAVEWSDQVFGERFELLDFDGDIYGRELTVAFAARLRPEQRFADIQALIVQMEQDVEQARQIPAKDAR